MSTTTESTAARSRRTYARARLVVAFGLASAVLIIVVGRWLDGQVRSAAERQALSSYQRTSEATFRVLTSSLLSEEELNGGVPIDKQRLLSEVVSKVALTDDHPVRVRLVSSSGRIAFSTGAGDAGTVVSDTWLLSSTDKGRTRFTTADQVGLSTTGRVFEFSVPLRFGTVLWGTIDVTGDSDALRLVASHDASRARTGLVFGLLALWLMLLPIVWSVSSRLKRQADENERLAQHDALTGLPNRMLLGSRLTEALDEGNRRNAVTGLMVVDLDDFKDVNDTLGHQAGDVMLQHIAHRIAGAVRPGDTVSRLGGDEFAVVVANAQHPSVIGGVADRLLDALEMPVRVGEVTITPSASIGIAMAPQHGTSVDQLMQRADIAMYAAKAGGLGRRTYSSDIDVHSTSKLTLAAELRAAMRDGEEQIDLVYQPIFNALTGEIVQLETLVRWNHPTRGELQPKDFVPLAERSGLVAQLTELTLGLALRQLRTWMDAGLPVRLGINLSSIVLQDQMLPGQVASALNRFNVPASLIEFEVTETSLLSDPQSVLVLLRQLRSLGATVSLDDFGSGYSSLTHLRSLEADSIKVDRSFVENMLTRDHDAKIVAAMVSLAHELGMTVTAEGVESSEQVAKLISVGCDRLQGFFLSYPLPAHSATVLLRERSVRGAMQPVQP